MTRLELRPGRTFPFTAFAGPPGRVRSVRLSPLSLNENRLSLQNADAIFNEPQQCIVTIRPSHREVSTTIIYTHVLKAYCRY